MVTAKLFKSGGSQAVRLPKEFRFSGTEVIIEKQGDAVLLKPKPKHKFKNLNEVARYLAKKYPGGADFPDIPRPKHHERPIIDLS
jgi:antitoxin VapB